MSALQHIRLGWIKFMYIYTIIGAGLFGLGMILIPDYLRSLINWPAGEPIVFGIAGSLFLSLGILSILGLRSPLKFIPILFLQLCYKTIWFLGVVLPMLLAGKFPRYAVSIALFWLTYIIGDLIAIPFRYLFAKQPVEMSTNPVN